MKYRLEISSVAESEADSAFLRLSQVIAIATLLRTFLVVCFACCQKCPCPNLCGGSYTSPTKASQWYSGLLQAIESLTQMPKRCPLARENEYFSQEIRQLLYGRGRSSYRLLFTILEGQNVSTVRILHIRHASQQPVGEEPKEPDASQ